jgi:hypothetical protein
LRACSTRSIIARVGAADVVAVDLGARDGPAIDRRADPRDLIDPRDDRHPTRGEQLLRDGARCDPPGGLSRARSPAARDGADPVLCIVGVIGVARAVGLRDFLVVLAARVLVADHHRDRRAERLAVEHARQDLDLIGLLALADQPALARPASIELGLDLRHVEREARRAAIDHDAERRTMRFAERRDPEQVTEARAHRAKAYDVVAM